MNAELQRQHAAHLARRAKLFPSQPVCRAIAAPTVREKLGVFLPPELPPIRDLGVQHNAHVVAYKAFTAASMRVRILRATCIETGFAFSELTSRSRQRDRTEIRQAAMYLLVEDANLSLSEAGRRLNRDHTTVLHAVRKIRAALADGDVDTVELIGSIRAIYNRPEAR